MEKERLDKLLVDRGLVSTRSQAKSLIEMGRVKSLGKVLTKAGLVLPLDVPLDVESPDYVGRGAFKLEAALSEYNVSVAGKTLIDIGASTGGFTEVLLRHDAAKVFAVDVGRDQLAEKIKFNPKVENMEGTHILDVQFIVPLDGVVMDLSFISLTRVMSHVFTLLAPGAWVIALVKPQFEAGTARLPKDGVVKDEKIRAEILQEVLAHFQQVGFQVKGVMDCPVEGKTGNREWLTHLVK